MASFYPFVDSSLVYTVYLIENSTGSNLSYYWDFGDGATSTQQYPTHVYSNYGLYDICLTVSDSSNCVSTSCITLLLDSVQKTFSGYTLIVVPQEPTTDIQQDPGKGLTDKVLIHPNPTTGVIHIKGVQGIASVYDIYGKVVMSSSTNTLNMSEAARGIYFIRVLDEQGKVYVAKVLKE
jgi:PKD repeat protein